MYHYYAEKGGLRFVILFYEGWKWIRLLETGDLSVHEIPAANLRKLKPYTKLKPKVMARRLRQRRTLYTKLGIGFSKKAVNDAIKKLET